MAEKVLGTNEEGIWTVNISQRRHVRRHGVKEGRPVLNKIYPVVKKRKSYKIENL